MTSTKFLRRCFYKKKVIRKLILKLFKRLNVLRFIINCKILSVFRFFFRFFINNNFQSFTIISRLELCKKSKRLIETKSMYI